MRRTVLILLFLLFFFAPAGGEDLKKLALDDVASIGLKIQADPITIKKKKMKDRVLICNQVSINHRSGFDTCIILLINTGQTDYKCRSARNNVSSIIQPRGEYGKSNARNRILGSGLVWMDHSANVKDDRFSSWFQRLA